MASLPVVYYCDCARFCRGTAKPVCRKTYWQHEQHRTADSQCSTPFQETATGLIPHAEPPPVRRKRKREDAMSEAESSRAAPEPPLPTTDAQPILDDQDAVCPGPAIHNDASPSSPKANMASNPPSPAPSLRGISPALEEPGLDEGPSDTFAWVTRDYSVIKSVYRCQRFIYHIRNATLEDCRLSEEQLHRLLHPAVGTPQLVDGPDGADRDLLLSIRLFLSHARSSEDSYEATRRALKISAPDFDVLHIDAVKKRIAELSGVYTIDDDLCVDSCAAFVGDYAAAIACPMCGKARYKPGTKKPRNRMSTYAIGPQIQAMHRAYSTAQQMDYWHAKTSALLAQLGRGEPVDLFDDVMCGTDILRALIEGKLGPDDTVLMASLDGLQLYRNKKSGCWMWIYVLYNIAPDGRYKKKYVLPGGIVPGPNKPSDMESILFRALQQISAINRRGGLPIWDAYRAAPTYRTRCASDGREPRLAEYNSRIVVLFATADAEAMPLWNGTVGPGGKIGCRLWCGLSGRRIVGKRGGHYYPMLAKPDDYTVAGASHGDQSYTAPALPSQERYAAQLKVICTARSQNAYATARRETGLCKPSILLGLYGTDSSPLILGLPNMCPGDNMHMMMNLAILFLNLWRAETDVVSPDDRRTWDWATLKDAEIWKAHGFDVGSLMRFFATSFERTPRNPAEKINSGYKVIEYINYFWVVGPVLFFFRLKLVYWKNYCKLVAGVRIICQKEIPRVQLEHAETLLAEFLEEFEALYIQRRAERMHFHTQVLHFVQHFCPEVRRIGPGALYAQWTLERTVGNLTEEVRQTSNPFRNLAMRGLLRAQINSLKAIYPILREEADRDDRPKGSAIGLGGGYFVLPARARRPLELTSVECDALREYIDQLELPHGNLDDESTKAVRWSGLKMPNGQIARSLWAQARNKSENKRDTCNVKINLAEDDGIVDPAFARVRYYFEWSIDGTDQILAMVELFGNPSQQHYADSSGTFISCQPLGDEDVRVLYHTKVMATVIAPPIPASAGDQWNGHHFIGERFGQEIAWWGPGVPNTGDDEEPEPVDNFDDEPDYVDT